MKVNAWIKETSWEWYFSERVYSYGYGKFKGIGYTNNNADNMIKVCRHCEKRYEWFNLNSKGRRGYAVYGNHIPMMGKKLGLCKECGGIDE